MVVLCSNKRGVYIRNPQVAKKRYECTGMPSSVSPRFLHVNVCVIVSVTPKFRDVSLADFDESKATPGTEEKVLDTHISLADRDRHTPPASIIVVLSPSLSVCPSVCWLYVCVA